MGSRIFNELLDEKIESFVNSFLKVSRNTFLNLSGKLIHPGEFGAYRESCCKEFLSYVVPQRLAIEEGFIINSLDEVSTECDIIIYDKANTPLIESREKQKFYPVESVAAIGEIKSTLNKEQLSKALVKLSQVKTFRLNQKIGKAISKRHDGEYNPRDNPKDNVFTFLICEKLDFNIEDVSVFVNNIYPENTHGNMRHNLLLSLNDGLFAYYLEEGEYPKVYPMPIVDSKVLMTTFIPSTQNYSHIKAFSSFMFSGVSDITLSQPDITNYLITPYMEAHWAK